MQPEDDKPQTPPCSYLGQVELPDLAADVLGQAAGEGDHPRQLLGVPLDELQVGAAHKTQFGKRPGSFPQTQPKSFIPGAEHGSQTALEGAVGVDERPLSSLPTRRGRRRQHGTDPMR